MIYVLPVENCSASNGQWHHHDQVGKEGKGTEDQMGSSSKPGLYNLKQKNIYIFVPDLRIVVKIPSRSRMEINFDFV